jgi:microcystin-dependent protein
MSTLNVSSIKNPSAGSAAITLDTSGNASVPSLVPPGTVQFYAANTAPAGWVKANGANVNRTTYADLFTAIGTTFGVGDGSTTFTLPDLRGEFARGWDDGRGVDSGRAFGSAQSHALQRHTHAYDKPVNTLNRVAGASDVFLSTSVTQTNDGGTTGDFSAETRPRNIALLAIIKF